jgi:hypothetical protein
MDTQMTKDTDTLVAIFGASRQQRRNTEIISMHARKQNEEAELVAVQVSLQHRLRNAALLEAAPVHACYLDARLIDALGLKGPPGELRFTKNNRQHLDGKVGRPNSDQIRDALHNPLYVSGRRRRPSECELIGLHSSQRLMLVALDLS